MRENTNKIKEAKEVAGPETHDQRLKELRQSTEIRDTDITTERGDGQLEWWDLIYDY